MTLRDTYPELLLDAWCCHEAFRRFGYKAEDIFIIIAQNGADIGSGLWLFAVLRTQGKEFTITIAPLGKLNDEELLKQWHRFCEDANGRSADDPELREIWMKGLVWRLGPHNLAVGLVNKGFYFPNANRNMN